MQYTSLRANFNICLPLLTAFISKPEVVVRFFKQRKVLSGALISWINWLWPSSTRKFECKVPWLLLPKLCSLCKQIPSPSFCSSNYYIGSTILLCRVHQCSKNYLKVLLHADNCFQSLEWPFFWQKIQRTSFTKGLKIGGCCHVFDVKCTVW